MENSEKPSLHAVLVFYGADESRLPDESCNYWRTIACPFHQDRRPSARVNFGLGAFICNGCGVSGDSIKIIQGQEKGLGYGDACKWAKDHVGYSGAGIRQATARKAFSPWPDE